MSDDLGAAAEWATIVRAAVLGTDRHPLGQPAPGWDTWSAAGDPAVQLLDRAAAVTVARRAGVRPARVAAAVSGLEPPPPDRRRPCPAPVADRLRRLVGGEHEVLLPEWFVHARRLDLQLPWEVLPLLLLRGRSRPELDRAVRELAGPRAAWLARVVPELGVKADTSPRLGGHGSPVPAFDPPPRPADSRAAVASVLGALADGSATWAAVPHLVQVVAGIDPSLAAPFATALRQADCAPSCERTRTELAWLADHRSDMLREFAAADPARRGDHR